MAGRDDIEVACLPEPDRYFSEHTEISGEKIAGLDRQRRRGRCRW